MKTSHGMSRETSTFLKKYIQLVYAQSFKFLFTFVFLHQSNDILCEGRGIGITAATENTRLEPNELVIFAYTCDNDSRGF